MAGTRRRSSRFSKPARRTQIVWGAFLAAMALASGLLALRGSAGSQAGFMLTTLEPVGEPVGGPAGQGIQAQSIFSLEKPLDRTRWTGIVIHDLGQPAGDGKSVHRLHQSAGLQGLGYHFLIGNGNGLADGAVHVGYRWNQQQPGAHVAGPQQAYHNNHSIGICLVGNGDRRPFTDRQISQLINLVQRLQRELAIPAHNIHLHRDLASGATSSGRFFPVAAIRQQLINLPR